MSKDLLKPKSAKEGELERPLYYKLKGRKVRPVWDIAEWVPYFETADRILQQEKIGTTVVSTVFLGIDHGYMGGPPLLFETMVFGGPLDQEQVRCSTYDEAEEQHEDMVKRVKEAQREST